MILKVRASEALIQGPRETLARFYRNVELVDARGSTLGEFDGIRMGKKMFVENTSAFDLHRTNPRTGLRAQTTAEWAARKIFKKTDTRIKNLDRATATRSASPVPEAVPALAEIQGFRHLHFMIDGVSPSIRAASYAELAKLRVAHPTWTFTVEFGMTLPTVPVPLPDQGRETVPSSE